MRPALARRRLTENSTLGVSGQIHPSVLGYRRMSRRSRLASATRQAIAFQKGKITRIIASGLSALAGQPHERAAGCASPGEESAWLLAKLWRMAKI